MDKSTVAMMDSEFAHSLDFEDLENIMSDSVAETADGCIVEPDGRCPHGHLSPLLVLGFI